MENREWFERRAMGAKRCIENFNDDAEERALAWAYDEIKRLRALLESALPHIECTTQEQNNLITAIGNALDPDA